ncbi:MAG: cytochrome c-type biogenesis protein CcmH [Alphaproteobacteria bacterium]|jgi:cytochrome c-type biogenesis protein CcmH|nr:cytochrome c-type biogenesis protein CcmH [Alphaproteobacteria bacterium]MBP9877211.1 cytochrome c-type biogenesis protein CcmH [Alphaproteobacteria bacterium]
MKRLILIFIFYFWPLSFSQAEEALLRSQEEANYQEITRSLRCLTCEAQSVFESDTPMAIAVKNYVKESLLQNQSEEEIHTYLRDLYGETIFFEPKGSFLSSALWLGPLILFVSGVIWVVRMNRGVQHDSR